MDGLRFTAGPPIPLYCGRPCGSVPIEFSGGALDWGAIEGGGGIGLDALGCPPSACAPFVAFGAIAGDVMPGWANCGEGATPGGGII